MLGRSKGDEDMNIHPGGSRPSRRSVAEYWLEPVTDQQYGAARG